MELSADIELVRPERIARVREALSRRLGSVVAVCEAVLRRHNVSAILRSAEAFGVHEVQLVTGKFRPSPGAARGAERWVLRRRFATIEESAADLRSRGFRIWVADLADEAWTPDTLPLDAPAAIVFGSEVQGVSAAARALADGAVRVPMHGLTESLNVSVSAAILLRTVAERQRARVGPDLDATAQERFVADWLQAEEKAMRGVMARAAER